MTRTLLLIAAFVACMVGSFIWFVATWDASKEEPVSFALPAIQPYENHTRTIPSPYGVS